MLKKIIFCGDATNEHKFLVIICFSKNYYLWLLLVHYWTLLFKIKTAE